MTRCDNCDVELTGNYFGKGEKDSTIFCDNCLSRVKPCSFLDTMTREQYHRHQVMRGRV